MYRSATTTSLRDDPWNSCEEVVLRTLLRTNAAADLHDESRSRCHVRVRLLSVLANALARALGRIVEGNDDDDNKEVTEEPASTVTAVDPGKVSTLLSLLEMELMKMKLANPHEESTTKTNHSNNNNWLLLLSSQCVRSMEGLALSALRRQSSSNHATYDVLASTSLEALSEYENSDDHARIKNECADTIGPGRDALLVADAARPSLSMVLSPPSAGTVDKTSRRSRHNGEDVGCLAVLEASHRYHEQLLQSSSSGDESTRVRL